jgi:cytochrome c oxidase assembly protein subunit 11
VTAGNERAQQNGTAKAAVPSAPSRALAGRHRNVALSLVAVVAAMGGMAYAAVPLYRLFCQATGYGGTPQIATKGSTHVLERTIVVRFDANVASALPWEFGPKQTTLEVKLGDNVVAHYTATNRSSRVTKGTAGFNVAPDSAGAYFNKVECFCFTEQTLQPGETVDMPVSFFVDPAILDDADARKLSEITLSYTFYPIGEPKVGAAPAAVKPATGPAEGVGGRS